MPFLLPAAATAAAPAAAATTTTTTTAAAAATTAAATAAGTTAAAATTAPAAAATALTLSDKLMLASLGVTSVAGIMQAQGAYSQGQFASKIAKANAISQKAQAESIGQAAAEKSRQFSRESEKFIATQRANIALSGTEASGSNILALNETARNLALDRLALLKEGRLSADTAARQAALSRLEGKIASLAASRQALAYYLGTGGTLLSGIGKYMYLKERKPYFYYGD